MITFKTKYNKKIEKNGIKIICKKEIANYDYKIEGEYNENMLEIHCLKCIFINPDKRYKIKFKNFEIIPNNYDENGGILNMENNKIEKYCDYDKNIVSFCLYGKDKMYLRGAIRNLEQYTEKYPKAKCYFYIREDVPIEIIKEIKKKGGVIINCVNIINWYMMFCRFLPFENPENKFYLSRDCDCRLINREIKAMSQWILSKKRFHIMRDHPWHGTLILGGMWGARNFSYPNLRFHIMNWCLNYINLNERKDKGPDQYFLSQLYDHIKSEIYVNDEFFNVEKVKFKINCERKDKIYIGEAYDENEKYDQKLRDLIKS